MKDMVWVFIGGGLGSVLRYLAQLFFSRGNASNPFPMGTFLINIAGCLLIGILLQTFQKSHTNVWNLLLVVGFCGGFTTFSSYSNEGLTLLKQGYMFQYILYAGGSVLLGLLATYGGYQIAKLI